MAVSARFGQSTAADGVAVRFDASEILHLIDRTTGSFRGGGFQRALASANAQAAKVVQEGMAKELDRQIGAREQRPGNRLRRSILNDRNVDVLANTFSVGLPSWMDQSPAALYWRRIEEGDPQTFTARILFTNNAVDSVGYGPPFARPESGGGTHMRMPQFRRRGVLVQGIGPFPAYEYSRGGFAAFARVDMADLYQRELRAVGIELSKDDWK